MLCICVCFLILICYLVIVCICVLLQESEASSSIDVKVLQSLSATPIYHSFSHSLDCFIDIWVILQMFLFCLVKLSEKVLGLNDLSGTVSPLEKYDKEETIEEEVIDEAAKKKTTDATKRFVVLFILAAVTRFGFCDVQFCVERCRLLKILQSL